jgi:hypothetical protein
MRANRGGEAKRTTNASIPLDMLCIRVDMPHAATAFVRFVRALGRSSS